MIVRKQGTIGLWWLVVITFGVYYFVWYQRVNRQLSALTDEKVPANGKWWSQLIPFYSLVGLHKTAKRLNTALAVVGSTTRVSPVATWLVWTWLFVRPAGYLQKRINVLHGIQVAKANAGSRIAVAA